MIKKYAKILFLSILGILFSGILVVKADENTNFEGSNNQKILAQLELDKSEIRLYQKIFSKLKKEDYKSVDRLSKKLDNELLLGHILAQKYLSKTYKADFQELRSWLQKYSDHPQANRIYNVALRKGATEKLPLPSTYSPPAKRFTVYNWKYDEFDSISPAQVTFLQKQMQQFRSSINSGKTKSARSILEKPEIRKLLPAENYTTLANNLAMKYLTDNYNQQAYSWGQKSVGRKSNSTGYWISGIAAWRLNNYKNAATNFKKVVSSSRDDQWMSSAGAYWAARSYQRLKNHSASQRWYKNAALYKRTFYGILASNQLGTKPDYNWDTVSYLNDFTDGSTLQELLSEPAIQRALALIYVQEEELAEQELRHQYPKLNAAQKEAALFVARHFQMHSLGIMISNELCNDPKNMSYDHTAYPVPKWKPQDGWKIDKALLLALTRQESAFSSYAVSSAGACGLMQLMPGTAAYIAKDHSLKKDRQQLMKAEYNLSLGQQYVTYLLEKPYIDGNLIYLMTAYNAGPGNLYKWQKSAKDNNDPLLFMEIIPSRETRIYIERVMANYWIYQIRLGRNTPTLEQLSKGKWPILRRD